MKTCPSLLLCLCLATSTFAGQWPLENASDATLTIHGTAHSAPGAAGQSLLLDGSSCIELKDSAALNDPDGFTFSIWFNPYELENGQQLIAGKNRYSLNERQWGLMLEDDGTLCAYAWQGGWTTIRSKRVLKAGHWHLATFTVEKTKAVLFLNGQPIGEVALTKPVAATAAPITLGGLRDDGKLRQPFHGALDEARFEPGVTAMAYQPVTATHTVPQPVKADFPLWDEAQKLLTATELPVLEGVEFHVIKRHEPEVDQYPWLHGLGLAWHKGKLYASFGHNKGSENTASEEARGRVSEDGGKTWGDVFTIDTGTESDDLAVSHGVFLSHAGRLWAFHGAFRGKMGGIHTRAYLLDETTRRWGPKGTIAADGFWALNQPVKMSDGNWIMPGIRAGAYSNHTTNPAAVVISHGDDLTKWDLVTLPTPEGLKVWGESGIIVDGAMVLNIARYGARPLALVSKSTDHGRTWTTMAESNLPMTTSKPAPGMLSTGQRYLVCTNAANNGGRRSPLTIALSKPGAQTFSKVFVIRPAEFPVGPGESIAKASLSYPCAIEHEGKLYVAYSNNGGRGGNHNSAELAIIPLEKLRVEQTTTN
ncbi:MAG: exo-alpha-sialidase [Prosthecobacter sp.]